MDVPTTSSSCSQFRHAQRQRAVGADWALSPPWLALMSEAASALGLALTLACFAEKVEVRWDCSITALRQACRWVFGLLLFVCVVVVGILIVGYKPHIHECGWVGGGGESRTVW
jgi:hypothetical protein